MISKLRSPDKNIERSIQNLYDKINEIITAVNQESRPESKGIDQEKMRIVEKASGAFGVEFRTRKGWVESDSTEATGFKFKDT